MSGLPLTEEESAAAAAALERAAEQGIHCIPIPTPFAVGRVNTYLIEDDPLTLVDSGPNSGKALDELEQGLAARGHRIEDLELLVITHQHIDHLGLTGILQRRSGAEVVCLAALQPYVERYAQQAEADDEFSEGLLLRHGVDPDVSEALRSVSRAFRAWGGACPIDRPLAPDATLALRDRSFEVQHRPGHSPSDTCFWDAANGTLIAGDHLLAQISSNPLIHRPLPQHDGSPQPPGPRPQALITYMRSLELTHELPAQLVLGGHGPPITDHAALIDERFRMHERRAQKILRIIGEQGPVSAHEIAHELWGNVAVTQAFLTLSEVLGHVDLLVRDRLVLEHEHDGVARFQAS